MQRADIVDLQSAGFLQDILDLRAVLADDVGVISSGFIQPVAHEINFISEDVSVKSTEDAKGIGTEQYLFLGVI